MRLPKEGLEYARIDFDGLPADTDDVTIEASLDRVTWYPTEPGPEAGDYLFLLRGPASTSPFGTLVPAGTTIWARVTGSPEVVVRKVGIVTLY